MGRKKRLTEAEIIHKHYKGVGKKGGEARRENLTAERRKEIAEQGAKARWKKSDA